ncbi:hypothetical protein COPEUT_01206 [Coprococcus eutactus ATCC 27759]|nr:hypothetical protein COPEUT_01206 [Coprococcus eutactus ATCC 27759]
MERYEREVWEYNLKLKQKEKPTKKPPEKQSVREHLRQLQEQGSSLSCDLTYIRAQENTLQVFMTCRV